MVKKAQLRQIEEGKKTSFRYRRQPVPNDKIKRYTQEYADGALSPIACTCIRCMQHQAMVISLLTFDHSVAFQSDLQYFEVAAYETFNSG